MALHDKLPRAFTACPHDCPSTCALEVQMENPTTVGRVYGAKANSYTQGVICAKVGRYAERVHHPDRLMKPLLRTGPGATRDAFAEVSWDEALDRVADAFRTASDRHGPETVWPYFFAGTMGLVQRDGIDRLRNVMGYSRQHMSICTTLPEAGWLAGVGVKAGVDSRELGESDLIVVWGGNPVHTQVNVMHHVTKARRERGAKLVVIDAYRTATADKADMALVLKPGTDGALACAVMHVLFAEGFADRDYLARYTDCPEQFEAHLATRTPEWAASITGLAVEQIVAFARLYGGTARSFLRVGYGFARARNGAANLHAVTALPAVTGAWQHRGGGALWSSGGGKMFSIDQTLIKGLDALKPHTRIIDMCRIGPALTGDPTDLGDGPPVTAMLIQNTNPMAVAPDLNKVHAGFARKDLFVCVHEQFLTDTAAVADIVLPATTFLEHEDLYTGGGHTHAQVTRRIMEPLGECRPNHYVHCELAKRLGAEHRGFGMTEWEIMDETLRVSGYPGVEEAHAARWLDRALPFEQAHFIDGFGHADGRFHFAADWPSLGPHAEGMPTLPDHYDGYDQASDAHPFRLVTAPARHYLNTSFTETPSSQRFERKPRVMAHFDDLAALGVASGETVTLGNALGRVTLDAEAFDGVQPGVLVVESVWPNDAFIDGIGINALVSADFGKPNGGGIFHDTAVWMRKA